VSLQNIKTISVIYQIPENDLMMIIKMCEKEKARELEQEN